MQDEEDAALAYLASDAQNINRLIELIRCAYKSNTTFSFPKISPFLPNVTLNNGETYRFNINLNKDIVDYAPQKVTPYLNNGYTFYHFQDFELGVVEHTGNTFDKYLFPADKEWNIQPKVYSGKISSKISSGNTDEAVAMLYEASNCVLSNLSYTNKYKLIKNISENFLQEDRKDYGVIELLRTIAQSKTESNSFYNDINKDPGIITSLYVGTDDEYTREKFISYLVSIFANYWEGKDIQISDNKYFVKDNNGLYTATEPVIHSGDKTITLIRWNTGADFTMIWDAKTCSPLEPVALINPASQKGKDDEIIYVPAINLLYLAKTQATEDIVAFLQGTAYLAGSFASAGLILKGASAVQKIIGVVDLANIATTVVLDNASIRARVSSTPEGVAFLEAWPTISNTINLATLSSFALDAFAKNGQKVLSTCDDILPELEKQRIKAVVEKCEAVAKGVSKHPNWVEVLDIRTKILAKKPHVLRIDINSNNSGFKGCHSKVALDDYVANNPTATYEFRNKVMDPSGNGVYEANPVIKLQNGTELTKTNNAGKSTFFPDNWDEAKILDDVEYAIANNQGKIPTKPNGNEYFGLSIDGKVEIHFYLNADSSIGSYFPIKK